MSQPPLSARRAIVIGQLIINLPISLFICSMAVAGVIFSADNGWWQALWCLLPGIATAWVYWSYAVPRWRNWAIRRGVPLGVLQRYGVAAGLLWPKGSIFERTEIESDE